VLDVAGKKVCDHFLAEQVEADQPAQKHDEQKADDQQPHDKPAPPRAGGRLVGVFSRRFRLSVTRISIVELAPLNLLFGNWLLGRPVGRLGRWCPWCNCPMRAVYPGVAFGNCAEFSQLAQRRQLRGT